MDIIALATRCDRGAAEAMELADRLTEGPSPEPGRQRRDTTTAHCLVRIADLWNERRPAIPLDPTQIASIGGVDVDVHLADLDAELASWSIDRVLDPSTYVMVHRIRSEITLIRQQRQERE